jgi:hypothetical protein
VCNDHYFSSLMAVRECHRRGYRRPGLLLHRIHQLRFQGRWEAGYLVAGRMLPGLKLAVPCYVDGWEKPEPILAWLRREHPDVIITPGAEGLLGTLQEAGYRVPLDLGLALLACPQPGDSHAGVYQNGRLTGALAVDTLISLVERNERGLPEQATTLMVEGSWNEGRTLRPLPGPPGSPPGRAPRLRASAKKPGRKRPGPG